MRWLLVIVTGLFVLWSGYWVIGSRAALNGLERWVANAPAQGLQIRTGAITLAGYPNRFDLTVAMPEYADATSGWSWSAPVLQVLALSYQPWRAIVALPDQQTLSRPGESIAITSDLLRASIRVFPRADLGLENIILEADAPSLTSDLGWTGSARRAVLALRKVAGLPNAYEFGLQIEALLPDPAFAGALGAGSALPAAMDSATADVIAVLTAPLDRDAVRVRPEIRTVEVKNLLVVWGPLRLHAEGSISPDDDGLAKGRIDIRITNWQHLVPLMVAGRLVRPELAQTAGNMLAALAEAGADPNVLALPLTLADGWMTLGPLPLGPAPALRRRSGF